MKKYLYLAVLLAAVQLSVTDTLFAQTVSGWQITGNRSTNALSFLGTADGMPLRLSTNNAARMIISSTGNVGIGNLTPQYTLDITGRLRLADGTQGAGKVLTSDAAGLVSWLTPISNPWTVSGNNLYNINTGNIGIGTLTPNAKLDVNADALINGVKIGKGKNSLNTNTILGALALDFNTTGVNNSGIGYTALSLNTTGFNNTAIGTYALSKNTSGINNTATGTGALRNNTNGQNNTANGQDALSSNTGGNGNTAMGDSVLAKTLTTNSNTAIGHKAMLNNVTGSYNTAVGQQALQYIKSGTYNTSIGYKAGSSGGDSAILTNATAIGANAKVTTNNSLVLGSGVNVGIGTTAPSARLDVVGKIKITDGTQQPGYVLTSDSTIPGLAKWKLAPGSLWVSSGTNAYYSLSGNIGIGTTSPVNKLSVVGNADVSGNMGIGTTNPVTKLQVGAKMIDDANFVYDANALMVAHPTPTSLVTLNDPKTVLLLARHGTQGQCYGAAAAFSLSRYNNTGGSKTRLDMQLADDIFMTNPTNVMTLLSGGNVGIGTAAPGQRLDVNGNLQFSNATLPKSFMDEGLGTTPMFTMGVNFHEATVNQVYRGGAYRLDTRDGSAIHNWFARLPNSAEEKLIMALAENGGLAVGSTFTSSVPPVSGAIFQGNVGIGISNPSTKLGVVGNVYVDGNVGIGNSYPQYKLHVNGGDIMVDGGYVRIKGNSGVYWPDWDGGFYMSDNQWIRTFSSKSITSGSGLLASEGGLTVGYGGTTPPVGGAVISGNVSIGTSSVGSTDYKLDVSTNSLVAIRGANNSTSIGAVGVEGRANFGTGIYGTVAFTGFAGYFNGNLAYTGTLSGPSDVRLKENIEPLENALSLISKLDAKTYSFKKEYEKMNLPKGKQFGLIAQDVEKVLPNLVELNYDKSMDKEHPFEYKAINYIGLIPLLTEAVKELKANADTKDVTITKLEELLIKQQAQINLLLQKVSSIDARQEACCTAAQQTKVVDNEQPVALTSASLDQNVPNPPVNHATRIGYNVPKGAGKAEMIITDNYGKKLKTINLSVMGKGFMNVDTRGLASGTYSYTLIVDGKMIDTKQMVVAAQ